MKRLTFATAFCLALVATPASAQFAVYGGGGAAFPTGGDLDGVESGVQLFGGATFDITPRLGVYAEGQFGSHGIENSDSKVKPSALMGGLIFDLMSDEDAPVSPYVFGGAGLQTVKFDPEQGDAVDDSAFGFQLGAGVGFDLLGLGAFAEGRYQTAAFADDADVLTDATFAIFSVAVGLSFQFGGS
jgi:opacity protein-like surface antigen